MSTRLTPDDRANLIERAKRAAVPVASCVAARLRPDHLLGPMSRDELAALVIVLAEACDHATLKAVTEAADDGRPTATDAELRLLGAYTEAQRLRKAGEAVPNRLACLESDYRRLRQEARQAVTAA